ncbi:GTP 3',8-cyclase MoaA [Uliginosibacterium sp. H3]|uniref:GTP 3',8-cyclase n=1 Tax=Uliginosibacterium silvisoli TaxID=3114758 RepID=A0ABU6K4H2_9RHOO|nr:GTP 3',8-cyclase MoaA [Uliginosibacterium sp. H3]
MARDDDAVSAAPVVAPHDRLGRPLRDLRISITDRCNFRCTYCMPRERFGREHAFLPRKSLLSFEEITHVARVFADLGVEKIRLTGGEPLLRKDVPRLVAMLAGIPGLELTLTTNAALLARQAQALKDAGLDRITVSLDSLNETVFHQMSDSDFSLQEVLQGIEAAEDAGFKPLKINMVVKRGVNDGEILDMVRHFRHSGHILRFIEYMDVGETNRWRMDEVLTAQEIIARIDAEYPLEAIGAHYPGEVAKRWRYRDGGGEIGIIASVTQTFCHECTRLRLSPEGKLFTCLFATQGHDLMTRVRGVNGKAGDSPEQLATWVSTIWADRGDRYSELRQTGLAPAGDKIEMSYIGG